MSTKSDRLNELKRQIGEAHNDPRPAIPAEELFDRLAARYARRVDDVPPSLCADETGAVMDCFTANPNKAPGSGN